MEQAHDQIRGQGSFEHAVKTLNEVKSLNHRRLNSVSAITTISQANEKDIFDLMLFVKDKLKVNHKLQLVRSSSTDVFNIDNKLLSSFNSPLDKPRNTKRLIEKLVKIMPNDNLLARKEAEQLRHIASILKTRKKSFDCLAGKIDGVIYSNGDVAFCEFTKPFANLEEYNFEFDKLWNSEAANKVRAGIKSCICTHPCNIGTSMLFDANTLKKLSLSVK
jgi:MoaA/NifB/PqqE/SkfB family radical SAM enzyme